MSSRKNDLWKVPLYCMIAGIVSFYLIVYVFGRFTIVTLPDGTITSDNTRILIVYGGVFVATVLVGGMFFLRKMTRKEIFFSATIIVVFQMIISLIQWILGGTTGQLGVTFMYLSRIYEWCGGISQLILTMTGNLWLGIFIQNLMPYLFIAFGQRSINNDVTN